LQKSGAVQRGWGTWKEMQGGKKDDDTIPLQSKRGKEKGWGKKLHGKR